MAPLLAQSNSIGLIEILILAIVQGIAEFLPISSSGHIVATSQLLGKEFDITELNIVLHAGTLLSIVLYYRKDLFNILKESRRVIPKIVVATIPAVVVGLALKKFYPELLNDCLLAGFMFVVTGFLLIALSKIQNKEDDKTKESEGVKTQPEEAGCSYQDISWKQAILIGCFQAAAILPGISRSGATIVAGCLFGLKRNSAATFSFLLAIPVILGATVLESIEIIKTGPSTPFAFLGLGFLISFSVGLLSLIMLVRWLGKGKLHLFAYYVIPLGFAVILWQIVVEIGLIESLSY